MPSRRPEREREWLAPPYILIKFNWLLATAELVISNVKRMLFIDVTRGSRNFWPECSNNIGGLCLSDAHLKCVARDEGEKLSRISHIYHTHTHFMLFISSPVRWKPHFLWQVEWERTRRSFGERKTKRFLPRFPYAYEFATRSILDRR